MLKEIKQYYFILFMKSIYSNSNFELKYVGNPVTIDSRAIHKDKMGRLCVVGKRGQYF